MIEMLRAELESSMRRGQGHAILFGVEKVELELKVAVSRKVQGEGGVEFWVITAKAGAEGSNEETHTFKLTLLPISPTTGKRIDVAGTVSAPISDE